MNESEPKTNSEDVKPKAEQASDISNVDNASEVDTSAAIAIEPNIEASTDEAATPPPPAPRGPLAARGSGPLAARAGSARPGSPAPSAGRPGSPPVSMEQKAELIDTDSAEESPADPTAKPTAKRSKRPSKPGKDDTKNRNKQIVPPPKPRVAVPSKRAPLPDDLEALLEQELAGSGVEEILGGQAGMPMRDQIEEGQRVQGTVIKKTPDVVFVSLGGPDEGAVPSEQFKEEPDVGAIIEVAVRGFNKEDGLYVLVLPGQAIDAGDWDDLDEGTVVEAFIAATCNGGVEAKVGSLRGFIPISQLSEFRVEDASEFVDRKLMCVVTECNARRRNLVLSHRAVLEREREERRAEMMKTIAVGDTLEGTVRKILDFGAFVDMGGIEGLVHISKMSWDHIKHPSEVLEEGQKVKVKIDKIDETTGKIGLSYRDLLDHPWDDIDAKFPLGSTAKGSVTRIANFGAFVRLATGIEGLIHISELAHHRVVKVDSIVNEGEVVEVKILSVDSEEQRIGLSLKATQAQPESDNAGAGDTAGESAEPAPEPCIKKQHAGPLKGGKDADAGGGQFGLKW